jgi:hypothetical protein
MGIRNVAAATVLILVAACADAPSPPHAARSRQPPALSIVRLAARDTGGYHVVPLPVVGRIAGTVDFAGAAPADSVVHPAVDADVCGATLVDVSVVHSGPKLARAIVWLDGITAGKALPVARRFDVLAQGCRLLPRSQAAVIGGTLDVRSADPVVHQLHLVRVATSQPIEIVPETEAGEVVPVHAALAESGLVGIRCDRHPWMRASVVVFAQPYFAVSDPVGAFAIDSVPPGRYAITVWHERFGSHTDSVTVTAAHTTSVTLQYPAATAP